jgi:hypothetical protein
VAEKVSIRIPANLAVYVKAETAATEKFSVINGEVQMSPPERVTLLFFLCYDKNPQVKAAALTAMKGLPPATARAIAQAEETHPKLVELLTKLFPTVADTPQEEETQQEEASLKEQPEENTAAAVAEETPADEEETPAEDEEEFQSKYQMAQAMGVGEKIKMALTGDKEWRTILIRDSNKLVNGAVVKNPRITEPEILSIAKSVIQNDEITRVICMNKEWIKNYEIRKALVLNNKTPLPIALRFMGFLVEKDLSAMAKSKNISSVLSNQARRLLATKKKA